MSSKLRERFARLGPTRAIDRVCSGSPAVFVLGLADERGDLRAIDGMLSLARRGMTMLRAKRVIEELIETGRVFVEIPTVEDADALGADLANAGIAGARVDGEREVDIRDLRERLGLTREQFAMRYGLEVETLRNWETGKRGLDAVARSYLRVIANDPAGIAEVYAPTPTLQARRG